VSPSGRFAIGSRPCCRMSRQPHPAGPAVVLRSRHLALLAETVRTDERHEGSQSIAATRVWSLHPQVHRFVRARRASGVPGRGSQISHLRPQTIVMFARSRIERIDHLAAMLDPTGCRRPRCQIRRRENTVAARSVRSARATQDQAEEQKPPRKTE